jgi:hypothetical protein
MPLHSKNPDTSLLKQNSFLRFPIQIVPSIHPTNHGVQHCSRRRRNWQARPCNRGTHCQKWQVPSIRPCSRGEACSETSFSTCEVTDSCLLTQASETKSKELGATVLAVDYNKIDSIVKILEDNKIDTVISTLGSLFTGDNPELALIQAADQSKVTKRYIPSTWGIRYTAE